MASMPRGGSRGSVCVRVEEPHYVNNKLAEESSGSRRLDERLGVMVQDPGSGRTIQVYRGARSNFPSSRHRRDRGCYAIHRSRRRGRLSERTLFGYAQGLGLSVGLRGVGSRGIQDPCDYDNEEWSLRQGPIGSTGPIGSQKSRS
jgi:hypothetical protein